MAEKGPSEINGQSVEHWLNILNKDAPQPLVANDTVVLMYKGREFFFVDGGIAYTVPSKYGWSYRQEEAFFLVAVGQPAVRLLSERQEVFRFRMGSAELAAFSIFRWSDFTEMLMAEKK